jgi:AcrR family transcriptional regulator
MRKTKSKTEVKRPAKERLLKAAADVFARDGLGGATTRAIARAAGVNEVTLFRLFGTKEKLLAAVVGRTFEATQPLTATLLPKPAKDLRTELANYARCYQAILQENLPLIRTMIGEIHHHRSQEQTVVHGIFKPLRAEFIARLEKAQHRKKVRGGIPLNIAVDLLGGMIFTGVLRRSSPYKPIEYTAREYLDHCVEVLARGIEPVRKRK